MAVGITVTIVICFLKCISPANMSGYVAGGQYSHIWQFPHSAYITAECSRIVTCGASILNQAILISAAHCLDACSEPVVLTYTGHEYWMKGLISRVAKFVLYKEYSRETCCKNDLAVLRLREELSFGRNVQRVILMRDPPFDEIAYTAGWGKMKNKGPLSIYLKHISQRVYKREQCIEVGIPRPPLGTFCGQHWHELGQPEDGDAGCALVLRKKGIQIGIVAYSLPHISLSPTIYTDVSYFYDWIIETAENLYCNKTIK